MYKYILESAGNINWMALFSLLTFFTVFVMAIWLMMRRSSAHLKHMADLPLQEDQNEIESPLNNPVA